MPSKVAEDYIAAYSKISVLIFIAFSINNI
jgi:hypothetical protein